MVHFGCESSNSGSVREWEAEVRTTSPLGT